ncbi:MAG: hypothetical protein Q8O83_00260 [bacterium]|nr:hypothetical protein [bacterium]
MKTYKEVPRFSEKTGKKIGTEVVVDQVACDYCGKILHGGDDGEWPEVTYVIQENGGSEPSFERFRSEADFDLYELFEDNEFFYCQDWRNDRYCDAELMKHWMLYVLVKNDDERGDLFSKKCETIAHVMYFARMRRAKEFLEKGPRIFKANDE